MPNILHIMADQMTSPLPASVDQSSAIKTHLELWLPVFPEFFEPDNLATSPADISIYAQYLRREGYHASLSGKMHFSGPEQLHEPEESLISDINGLFANLNKLVCDSRFPGNARIVAN